MQPPVRLRQVAVITRTLDAVVEAVEHALGLRDPYLDPGVATFGLENRVYAAGDCFVEILTPRTAECAGARFLDRRGSDGGYMAIFQFADRDAPRARAAAAGTRVVWHADLDDISGTHLHPSDVGGAIVSLDWASPPESWRWGGPRWTGGAPPEVRGGIRSMTLAADDAVALAERWCTVLGPGAHRDGTDVVLDDAAQTIHFVAPASPDASGIVGCALELPGTDAIAGAHEIAGVRFDVSR